MGSARAAIGSTQRVWDPLVRLFHWGTVALFTAAYLSPHWRPAGMRHLHDWFGYAILVLLLPRILWGFIGSRHARFADFVHGPRAVLAYLRQMRAGAAPRHLGHNPAGGAMVVALMAMLGLTILTGWLQLTNRFYGVSWIIHLHHYAAHLMILLVIVHVGGVIHASWHHRENLVRAMLTGRKASCGAERSAKSGELSAAE